MLLYLRIIKGALIENPDIYFGVIICAFTISYLFAL